MIPSKTQQHHIDVRDHQKVVENESAYDKVKIAWSRKISEIGPTSKASVSQQEYSESIRSSANKGWALKTSKRVVRMSPAVRDYLLHKFNAGAVSVHKADSAQVSKEMMFVGKDGKLVFAQGAWRTQQQIASYYSRLSAQQRQKQLGDHRSMEEEDIAAWEAEDARIHLRNEVFAQVDLQHPVTYRQLDICDAVARDRLKAKPIKLLKDVCEHFGLRIANGNPSRRNTYMKPSVQLVNTCKCRDEERPTEIFLPVKVSCTHWCHSVWENHTIRQ